MTTWPQLNAWAETTPLSPDTPGEGARVGDPCPICQNPLATDETCYAVVELDRADDGTEQWVCWRHIRGDAGPLS